MIIFLILHMIKMDSLNKGPKIIDNNFKIRYQLLRKDIKRIIHKKLKFRL